MLKTKKFFLSLLLSFLLFLFIINSIYVGMYSFINPFFYIYFGVTLILLFSIIGPVSGILAILSFAAAFFFLLNFDGTAKFSGYFNHVAFGMFFAAVAIIQFFIFILVPYAFSYMILKGRGVEKSIYFPVLAVFLFFFIFAGFYIFADKINVVSSLDYLSVDMAKKLIAIYARMGMKYFTTLKMRNLISEMMKFILLLIPSILVIFSWMSVWISFIFLKKISKRTNSFFYRVNENLSVWKVSDYFLLFLIVGIIISIFSVGIFKYIGYNIILLSSSVYLVQGLTIISFFFNKLNINIFLRILGYCIIFIFSNPIIIFVIMAGIFDMWFNFRKLETQKRRLV
jgi:hypothetical protein